MLVKFKCPKCGSENVYYDCIDTYGCPEENGFFAKFFACECNECEHEFQFTVNFDCVVASIQEE